MNLDDLMEVWRAQDASPLEDKTLLHLALRQEQAKLQRDRRIERGFMYLLSVGLVVGMGLFLGIMIYPGDDDLLSIWDYVIPVVGAAAALVMLGAMYAIHRLQAARDRDFGQSLRDQLRRRIAQLDDQVTKERRLLGVLNAAALICGLAIYLAGARINDASCSEIFRPNLFNLSVLGVFLVAIMSSVRSVRRDIGPRKSQLEGLLEQLDSQ